MENCKAFLDTNIILEHLLDRENAAEAENLIFNLGKQQCFVSLSSFYTITYYVETHLKKQGLLGDERITLLRKILNSLLCYISVASINESELLAGINNPDFKDLEDSYQLETAKSAGCDVLITYNLKDFKDSTSESIKVLTPSQFLLH